MNKIRVIDILNKIANGEAPKKIKYNNTTYYLYDNYNYLRFDKTRFFDSIYFKELNDEIEIIEEDKKIEKINWKSCADNLEEVNSNIDDLSNKINEIIDYLEEKE